MKQLKIYNYLRLRILLFVISIFIFNCKQEDDLKPKPVSYLTQTSTVKSVSERDIPQVINFIQS